MNISFIGAGNVATNLGNLLSQARHTVSYGVRTPENGQLSIADACEQGEMVCFAIPFSAMEKVLTENRTALKGKIVVDITNAINLEDWSPLFLGEDSGGEQTARLLPESKVVKAFNTVFADVMHTDKQIFDGKKLTTFVASDDEDAAEVVKTVAEEAGFHAITVRGLKNARHLEALAHLNIAIALGGGGTDAGIIYSQRA